MAAIALLYRIRDERSPKPGDLILAAKSGKPLSDMTLSKVLKDTGVKFTVHGFRRSFRDWAAEPMPSTPDPVAEAVLAHVVSGKVIVACKRTTFLQMRRALLEAWGRLCLA